MDYPSLDLYVLSESNRELKLDSGEARRNILFKEAGLRLQGVNKAKILTAMAIADAKHDHTNKKGYLTYLMCEDQSTRLGKNVKKRIDPKNFKQATEGRCLEAVFGTWNEDAEKDDYYPPNTDARNNNPTPSHSLKIIKDKYHIAMIGSGKTIADWDNEDDVIRERIRNEGYQKMATDFKNFLGAKSLSVKNIIYHCDATQLGWDRLQYILNPDGFSPFLIQTRASLTDPATKPTERTQEWLGNRHTFPNGQSWGYLREKPDTKLESSVVNSYVYNEVKDCKNDSVNESWLDTLVSKQKVTHMLEDYDNAYVKLEKKGRDGVTKTIYYDGFLSAKKIGATDIVLRNKERYTNNITKVISGSHALAKRCGDWCQAIQTKREFKTANYEEYFGSENKFIDAGSEEDYDIPEDSIIQCLITHDRILKAYALTIGVPMIIFTVPKREQDERGPGMEIYIDRSYSSRKQKLMNKLLSIEANQLSLEKKLMEEANFVDRLQEQLILTNNAIKSNITKLCTETKNLISTAQLNEFTDSDVIRELLSSGTNNFYYKFIVNIATLYHVLSSYTTAIVEITAIEGTVSIGDVWSGIKERKIEEEREYTRKKLDLSQQLTLLTDDPSEKDQLDSIERQIPDCESYITLLENELSILNLAKAGLNNAKFNEIKDSVNIFSNTDKIEWCSPFKFLKRYGNIVSLSCLTTSIPRKLCIEYIRKLSFIRQQLIKIYGDTGADELILKPDDTIFAYYSDSSNVEGARTEAQTRDAPNPPTSFSRGIFFDYEARRKAYFNRRKMTNLSQYILFFNSVVYKEYVDAVGSQVSTGGGRKKKQNFIQKGGNISKDVIFGNNIASYMLIQNGYDKLEEIFMKAENFRLEIRDICAAIYNRLVGAVGGNKVRLDSYQNGFLEFLKIIQFDEFESIIDKLYGYNVLAKCLFITGSEIGIDRQIELLESIIQYQIAHPSLRDIFYKLTRGNSVNSPRGLYLLEDVIDTNSNQLQAMNRFNFDLRLYNADDRLINAISDKITFLLSYFYSKLITDAITDVDLKKRRDSLDRDDPIDNVLYIMEPTIRTDKKYIYSIKKFTQPETAYVFENPEFCTSQNNCLLLMEEARQQANVFYTICLKISRLRSSEDDFDFDQLSYAEKIKIFEIVKDFFKKGYIPTQYLDIFTLLPDTNPGVRFPSFHDIINFVCHNYRPDFCREWNDGDITLGKSRKNAYETIKFGWKWKFAPEDGLYFILSEKKREENREKERKKKERSKSARRGAVTRQRRRLEKFSKGTSDIGAYVPSGSGAEAVRALRARQQATQQATQQSTGLSSLSIQDQDTSIGTISKKREPTPICREGSRRKIEGCVSIIDLRRSIYNRVMEYIQQRIAKGPWWLKPDIEGAIDNSLRNGRYERRKIDTLILFSNLLCNANGEPYTLNSGLGNLESRSYIFFLCRGINSIEEASIRAFNVWKYAFEESERLGQERGIRRSLPRPRDNRFSQTDKEFHIWLPYNFSGGKRKKKTKRKKRKKKKSRRKNKRKKKTKRRRRKRKKTRRRR